MTHRLEALLNPQSIAFIGASDRKERIGGMPIDLLASFGYQGQVYPVNPKYTDVFGYRCYPGIEDLPEAPDLVVLAIGAHDVLPMLQRCHQRGAKAAIVYAAGFAEEGTKGKELQDALEAFVAQSGLIVAGPNCMGFANINRQAHTAFASVFKAYPMQTTPGTVSLLTQSGNVCAVLYALLRQMDMSVSQFINTGNEACLEFAEYLEYLAHDPDTEVILGYIEQLRDGARFVQACHTLSENNKVLIALKAGTSAKGSAAVQSHTSAMAGDQAVYASALSALNVIQATDFTQMALIAKLARLRHRDAGHRVAVVTMSGAMGAILADRFTEQGLDLPDLPAHIQTILRSGIPDYGMVGNPVDVTGNVVNAPEFVREVFNALSQCDAVDAIVVYAPGYLLDRMADAITEVAQSSNRFIAVIDTGRATSRAQLEAADVAFFDDIGRAVCALGPFLQWQTQRKTSRTLATPESKQPLKSLPLPAGEAASLTYLHQWGLPIKTSLIATTAQEASQYAADMGCPVVLKIVSPDIAHKTEAGGVVLNIGTPEDAAHAFEQILRSVHASNPHARITGVMVQTMEPEGVELIVGARRDPVFGPMITVGLGGTLTEIYKDLAHTLLPVSTEDARKLLEKLTAFQLLQGYRNTPAGDIQAACQAISAIGQALLESTQEIAEIEVNPLRVKRQGQGVVALDALILPRG